MHFFHHPILLLIMLVVPGSAQETTITGKVSVTPWTEITGAHVTLLQNQQTGIQDVSNAKGEFQFSKIAPGDYHIFVFMPGYVPFDQPLQAVAGEPVHLEVQLKERPETCAYPPPTGKDRARLGSLKVQVSSVGPLPCATIELVERGRSWRGPMSQTELNGETGFRDIEPGEYEVVARFPGFQTLTTNTTITKGTEKRLTLQMVALEPSQGSK